MAMSTKATNLLHTAIQECGYKHRAYSGRGMGGKQRLGVDVDNALTALMRIMATLDHTADEIDEVYAYTENVKSDSMGTGQILYFPDISM